MYLSLKITSALALLLLSLSTYSQTFVFAQLNGEPTMNTAGWNLTGNAVVGNTNGTPGNSNNELILTQASNDQSGGVFWGQPIDLNICTKWTVEFDFRINDGNGADGLAFCFLDVPPTGFVGGGGVGIPNTANGLKVVIDTYNNCGGPNPELQIFSGVGYNECAPGIIKAENIGGIFNFIRNNEYRSAKITYDAGNVQFFINNTLYLSGFAPANFVGYMGFTSSTGGSRDRHSLRNVVIYTEQATSDAGLGGAASVCSGQPLTIGTTNNPEFTYSWSPVTGLNNANISNPTATLINAGSTPITQTYTVTTSLAASPGVCPTTDNIVITVNPNPTSTFTLPSSVCIGNTANISYSGNMGATANYTWNFDGGTVVSGSGQGPYQVSWNTSGTKTITLQVVAFGCTSTVSTQTIEIFDLPTSSFSVDPTFVCQNTPINILYSGTGTPTSNYNWDFDGGTIVSGSGQGPYQVSWGTQGSYYVALTVSENGCTSTLSTVAVEIFEFPQALFTADTELCGNEVSNILYTGTAPGNTTYTWDFDGGNIVSGTNAGPYNVNWNSSGTYTVTVVATNGICESEPSSIDVNVYDIPVASFTSPDSLCANETGTIIFDGTAGNSATYNWTFNGGSPENSNTQGPHNVSWVGQGNFELSLVVSENGCNSATEIQNIKINPIPTANFNAVSNLLCDENASIQTTGLSYPSSSYQWDYDGGTATGNAPNNISVSWNTLGEKEITLIIVDRGCESPPFTQTFINGSQPQSMFTLEEQCFQVVDFTNLSSDVENVSISFEWDFGDGNLSNEQQLTHTYQTEGSYNVTLSVENEYGCKDVYSLIANVIKSVPLPELALPNILTPNGDGINDMYELPVQVEDCYEYEILFYNRWGQLVFRQTENSDYFNGKSSGGAELSAGVYFVMLKSKEVTLNSTITLVR